MDYSPLIVERFHVSQCKLARRSLNYDRRELLRPVFGILNLLLEVLFFGSLEWIQLDRQLIQRARHSELVD